MQKAVLGARIVLGLIFFAFGLNYFLHFIPMPEEMPPEAGAFMGALAATGYMFYLIKVTEIVEIRAPGPHRAGTHRGEHLLLPPLPRTRWTLHGSAAGGARDLPGLGLPGVLRGGVERQRETYGLGSRRPPLTCHLLWAVGFCPPPSKNSTSHLVQDSCCGIVS